MIASTPAPWWLDAAPVNAQGLSTSQAREALEHFGPNTFAVTKKRPLALQFLVRFRNPLVLVLLAASAVSAATGDVANFVIIMLMVLLSVALDFIHEHRASRAAEKLRESVALRASVIRDGVAQEMPVTALVPGDLVLLAAGDRVPADWWPALQTWLADHSGRQHKPPRMGNARLGLAPVCDAPGAYVLSR